MSQRYFYFGKFTIENFQIEPAIPRGNPAAVEKQYVYDVKTFSTN
jgi:hypothetical protein